jgi:prepilin-type N-terminal cleavage/methylation domain-containing protein
MRHGFTLLELVAALLLLGMATSMLLPAARRVSDRSAVVGAREAMVGMISRTRGYALAGGGATLTLIASEARARAESGDSVVERIHLGRGFGVEVELSRGRDSVSLSFDALGIGRVASQTVRLRRGECEAALVISAYGRVTRR